MCFGCVLSAAFLATLPALAQYHVYWGDVHGHTELSDGKGTVGDYFTYARDVARLDFVILTDHDFGHAAPWRMPKEDWTRIQATADEFNTNGRFVAVGGYEWTSQPKYWTGVTNGPSERLFPGPPRFYNHKNVYFPGRVDYLFSAKDSAYNCPDALADVVRRHGGLIHNNHPEAGGDGREQFDYDAANSDIIANTEMLPDERHYQGKTYELKGEQTMQAFLNRGGKTGFVAGSDTHEGKPAPRTAVLAKELTRAAIFDALRHRRNYAVTNTRIILDFRINGHVMGEEMEIQGNPRVVVAVKGTDRLAEISVVRDGSVLRSVRSASPTARLEFVDDSFSGLSYYYARVIQADEDGDGNPSCAWSSPIWVSAKHPAKP